MDEQQRRQQRNERVLASVEQFLIDGGEEKAATLLLSCDLNCHEVLHKDDEGNTYNNLWSITLPAPRASYQLLAPLNRDDFRDPEFRIRYPLVFQEDVFSICDDIANAFSALLGNNVAYAVRASLIKINDQWREELLALLRGDHVTNQGLQFSPKTRMVTWNNLRFRSGAEVRIAEALERAQVLFLPNCMARLGFSHRENREPDFLICHRGKWDVLEVDGPLSHPPARKVDDDERARLFKAHGIRLVEHFDAGDCLENADGVVKRFLYLLGQ
jgi:hypothetical protein